MHTFGGILVFQIFLNSYLYAQQPTINDIHHIYQLHQNQNKNNTIVVRKFQKNFYKKYISKQISAKCQFNTSCSEFMSEAVHKKGLFLGLFLGIDRFSRCGGSDNTYNYLPSLEWKNGITLIDDLRFYE
jgi:putative component of membrane protein insertase Oxa1/YidC/SpoIIIJ protein YidD